MTVNINAENEILGRLASKVAMILRGKNKADFQPHILSGDPVVVYNAEKIKVTGRKPHQKTYYRHSGYIGHLKSTIYDKAFAKNPAKVIEHAVAGMLPKNRLRKHMLKKLTIVKGPIDVK